MSSKIEQLVVELSKDPFNPQKNLDTALEYERLKQTASAVSFYLRAAEYGHDSAREVVYTSLLRIAVCIESQKGREHTVSNVLLQAIAYWPDRPEAYFQYARFHERSGNWQECYTMAVIGLNRPEKYFGKLEVDYPGEYGLRFEQAISAWWIGRRNESIALLKRLRIENLSEEYRTAVEDNLRRIDATV